MTVWRKFHSINEDLAFALGLSLNVLLLFVIKKVKIKAMQKYNILLIQCCCIDLLQVVVSFIVKPVTVVHKKSLYYLSNGYLRPIGGPVEMFGIVIWVVSVFFCVNSMPISFVFRYRTLCLDANISGKFYVISLIVAALNSSVCGILIWKFNYLENRNMTYMAEEGFAWLMADDEGKVKAASVCFTGTLGLWIVILDTILVAFMPYLIMITYHIKILKHFKYYEHSLTASSKRVQMDLNRILMAQAIIPLFTAIFPMGFQVFSGFIEWNLVFETFICGILYCWIPVSNAISILFFVTAYRESLKRLLSCVRLRLPRFMPSSITITVDS